MRLLALTKKELAKSTKKSMPFMALWDVCVWCASDLLSKLVQEWQVIIDIIKTLTH